MNEGAYLMNVIRSRCVEEGDCLIWPGAANARGPVATHHQKQYSLRQIAWSQKNGKPFPSGRVASTNCGRALCLKHVTAKTWAQLNSRTPTLAAKAQVAIGKRRGSKLSDAAVAEILTSEERVVDLAGRHGISTAYAYMIRRGQNRKNYASPFAGLFGLGARQGAGA
jgi:hypothetical protein